MSDNYFADLKENLKNMGIGIETFAGENVFPISRVKNDPINEVREEIKLPPLSPEMEDKRRQRENKILKRRMNNFSNGVDLFEKFERVNIEEMNFCPDNWNYFNPPNKGELIKLIGSIECLGIVNPLILVKEVNNSYTIISGKSRVISLKNLYKNTGNEKYKFAPAFVLDSGEVDEFYLRMLIIDSNMPYRTISQSVIIMAVIEKFELLKRSNQFRSDTKIAESLAEEFLLSRSTIFNYLTLKNLREEIMVLLLEKRIKLEAAKYLAMVNHDVQLMILENFGIEHINELHRVKFLTTKDDVKLPELLRRIEVAKNLVPFKTKITLTVNKYVLPKCLEYVSELKKYAIINFENKFNSKNADTYCKVSLDYDHMKFYLEKEVINKSVLDLVLVKKLRRIKKNLAYKN